MRADGDRTNLGKDFAALAQAGEAEGYDFDSIVRDPQTQMAVSSCK